MKTRANWVLAGSCRKRSLKASSPPADAPMPTTGHVGDAATSALLRSLTVARDAGGSIAAESAVSGWFPARWLALEGFLLRPITHIRAREVSLGCAWPRARHHRDRSVSSRSSEAVCGRQFVLLSAKTYERWIPPTPKTASTFPGSLSE